MIFNNKDMLSILIRELCVEDYDDLIKLWNDAKLIHKRRGRDKKENIERELKKPTAIFLIAEKDGKLIGSIFGTHDGRKGWINRLAVAPPFRKQGIAAKLLKEVEERIFAAGIGIIASLVEDWNADSIDFFEKQGYKRHPDIIYFSKRKHPDV